MSFDFNNISGPKPVIQEAQSMLNNGGGGNLGYFQSERKETFTAKEESPEDSFQKNDVDFLDGDTDEKGFFDKIYVFFGNFFKYLKNFFEKILKFLTPKSKDPEEEFFKFTTKH